MLLMCKKLLKDFSKYEIATLVIITIDNTFAALIILVIMRILITAIIPQIMIITAALTI